MREWLTVIIALLILAVVLDGVRRMRQARRSNIRMRLSMHQGTSKEDLEVYGSELPNGGARVANVRKEDDAKQLYRQMRQTQEEKKRRLGRPNRIPQQVALNLDEQVPTLMEVEQAEPLTVREPSPLYRKTAEPSSAAGRGEPDRDDGRIEPQLSDVLEDLDQELADTISENVQTREPDPDWGSVHTKAPSAMDSPTQDEEQRDDLHDRLDYAENYDAEDYDAEDYDVDDYDAGDYDTEDDEPEDDFREPEVVLVINVMAPKGERFRGDELLETVLARGMRFGSMDIFHHHAQSNGDGGLLYSMANIVMPGTFNLAAMKTFTTPGVSLFLALPLDGDTDSGKAFETMLTTAKTLASTLGGELKDENRSVLTAQTVEHYRGRIKEFERKQLSKTPA